MIPPSKFIKLTHNNEMCQQKLLLANQRAKSMLKLGKRYICALSLSNYFLPALIFNKKGFNLFWYKSIKTL